MAKPTVTVLRNGSPVETTDIQTGDVLREDFFDEILRAANDTDDELQAAAGQIDTASQAVSQAFAATPSIIRPSVRELFIDTAGSATGTGRYGDAIDYATAKTLVPTLGANVVPKLLFKRGQTYEGGLSLTRSGKEDTPIILDAYGDALPLPVITAGRPVTTAWTTVGGGVYKTTLPAGQVAKNMFRDGVQMQMARTDMVRVTNSDYTNFWLEYNAADLTRPTTITDVRIATRIRTYRWHFSDVTVWSGNRITMRVNNDPLYHLNNAPSVGYGFYMLNHPDYLSTDGEWCWVSATNELYVYLDQAPSNYTFRYAQDDYAINLGTTVNSNVRRHVHIKNLELNEAGVDGFRASGILQNLELNGVHMKNCRRRGAEFRGKGSATDEISSYLHFKNCIVEDCNGGGLTTFIANNSSMVDCISKNIWTGSPIGHFDDSEGQVHNCGHAFQMLTQSWDAGMLNNQYLIDRCYAENTGGCSAKIIADNSKFRDCTFINGITQINDYGGGIYCWATTNGATNNIFIDRVIVDGAKGNTLGLEESSTFNAGASIGVGIYLDEYCNNIYIRGCSIFNSGDGIVMNRNNKNNTVTGNKFGMNTRNIAYVNDQAVIAKMGHNITDNIELFASTVPDSYNRYFRAEVEQHITPAFFGEEDRNLIITPYNNAFIHYQNYRQNSTIFSIDNLPLEEFQKLTGREINSVWYEGLTGFDPWGTYTVAAELTPSNTSGSPRTATGSAGVWFQFAESWTQGQWYRIEAKIKSSEPLTMKIEAQGTGLSPRPVIKYGASHKIEQRIVLYYQHTAATAAAMQLNFNVGGADNINPIEVDVYDFKIETLTGPPSDSTVDSRFTPIYNSGTEDKIVFLDGDHVDLFGYPLPNYLLKPQESIIVIEDEAGVKHVVTDSARRLIEAKSIFEVGNKNITLNDSYDGMQIVTTGAVTITWPTTLKTGFQVNVMAEGGVATLALPGGNKSLQLGESDTFTQKADNTVRTLGVAQ